MARTFDGFETRTGILERNILAGFVGLLTKADLRVLTKAEGVLTKAEEGLLTKAEALRKAENDFILKTAIY